MQYRRITSNKFYKSNSICLAEVKQNNFYLYFSNNIKRKIYDGELSVI